MKIRSIIIIMLILLLILGSITSCTSRLIDFTIISSKNIDLSDMDNYVRLDKRIEKFNIRLHYIFILPIPGKGYKLKEVLDNVIESMPGCVALVDGVVYYKKRYFIIYNYEAYQIEGTPLVHKNKVAFYENKFEEGRTYVVSTCNGESCQTNFMTNSEYENYLENIKTKNNLD